MNKVILFLGIAFCVADCGAVVPTKRKSQDLLYEKSSEQIAYNDGEEEAYESPTERILNDPAINWISVESKGAAYQEGLDWEPDKE